MPLWDWYGCPSKFVEICCPTISIMPHVNKWAHFSVTRVRTRDLDIWLKKNIIEKATAKWQKKNWTSFQNRAFVCLCILACPTTCEKNLQSCCVVIFRDNWARGSVVNSKNIEISLHGSYFLVIQFSKTAQRKNVCPTVFGKLFSGSRFFLGHGT